MFKFFEKNRWLSVILTIVVVGIIFILSNISFTGLPAGVNWMTIVYHILIFFLLTFFLFASIKGTKRIKLWHVVLVLVLTILYAFSDEFHQAFVPGRSSTLRDVLYDTTGIFFSVFFYVLRSNNKSGTIEEKAYQTDIKDEVNGY